MGKHEHNIMIGSKKERGCTDIVGTSVHYMDLTWSDGGAGLPFCTSFG